MKYGILTYQKRPMRVPGQNRVNLGDPIQEYTMRYLYSRMNINENELVEVSRYHAGQYAGDYVVLPFHCFNRIYDQLGRPYQSLPVSPKIVPVFFSFHLHSRVIDQKICDQFKMYQPVGCRDEETLHNMMAHGIPSYLSGCVTALLPKREKSPQQTKVFFVDVPESLLEYVPNELKKNAEYTGHHHLLPRLSPEEQWLTDEEYQLFYRTAVNQLKRYGREACLVVTSRLHAAAPCMAMGIPVILANDSFDGRFSWIEKYLPLYTKETFRQINWSPAPVEYEQDKEKIISAFSSRIKRTFDEYASLYDISSFYHHRERIVYNQGIINAIRRLSFDKEANIKFGVWVLTTKAEIIKNVAADYFRKWIFAAAIDSTSNGSFEGIQIQKPEEIVEQDQDIIYFVFPESAHKPAQELLTKLNRRFVLVKKTEMEYFERHKIIT